MRQRTVDLALVLEGPTLARTGLAILAHEALPHPLLQLVEELHPREVARARFQALWAERDQDPPHPEAIARHFRDQLAAAFAQLGQLEPPYALIMDADRPPR
jgi:hypothetical protein